MKLTSQKLEEWGYRNYGKNLMILSLTVFVIHRCDGQTDGRAIAYNSELSIMLYAVAL